MAEATALAVGTPCWWELATHDPNAAVKFYTDLCGWTVEERSMGHGPYHLLFRDGVMFGGAYSTKDIPGMEQVPPHWGTYFNCDDVDATIKRRPASARRS